METKEKVDKTRTNVKRLLQVITSQQTPPPPPCLEFGRFHKVNQAYHAQPHIKVEHHDEFHSLKLKQGM